MPEPSRAAAILALQLARDRAGNMPLVIDGDDKQRQAVLDTAVQLRFDVRFADPTLEAERVRRIREIDAADGEARPERRAGAIALFIAQRNAWPDPADPTYFRALSETDVGEARLVATHRLRGADVALWRGGDETLVQDISDQPNALAHNLLPGDSAGLATVQLPPERANEQQISSEDRGIEMD